MQNQNKKIVVTCPKCRTKSQLEMQGHYICHEFFTPERKRVNFTWWLNICTNCNWAILLQTKTVGDKYESYQEVVWPYSFNEVELPSTLHVNSELRKEYLEAVKCLSLGAYRATVAMLRSTLEKILEVNGYKKEGNLKKKLESAYSEGIIQKKNFLVVDEIVRLLGNDILHGDYREVSKQDAIKSKEYVERIFEDFYDQRDKVEIILKEAKRI